MTTEKLQAKVRRHNMLQTGLGIAMCAAAPVLWIASFFAARYAFYYIATCAGFHGMWGPSFYVGAGFVVLLAIEGVRGSWPLFDLMDYAQSDFNSLDGDWFNSSNGMSYTSYRRLDPFFYAWIAVQFLRLAPQTTIYAIQTLRSVIHPPPDVIKQAASIFAALKADRHWHAAEDFGDCAAALRLLIKLGLIWTNAGPNGLEIRFPAGMTEAELV